MCAGTGGGGTTDSNTNDNNKTRGEERNAGRIDAFVVPRPSKYVPDWAAFGPADNENGEPVLQKREVRLREGLRCICSTPPLSTHLCRSTCSFIYLCVV